MTILVDREILDYLACKKILIEPAHPARVQPNSYDLSLGDSFQRQVVCKNFMHIIDPMDQNSINVAFKALQAGSYILSPGEFILAETREKITLPADIVGCIEGKSSVARLGVEVHLTGGWVDAGFSGTITLEMVNNNAYPVKLRAGMPICQIVFFQTTPADHPYYARKSSKYMGQHGATLSRYAQNKTL